MDAKKRRVRELAVSSFKSRRVLTGILVVVVLIALIGPGLAIGWVGYRFSSRAVANEKIAKVGRVADRRREALIKELSASNRRARAFLEDVEARCSNSACLRHSLVTFAATEISLGAAMRIPGSDEEIRVGTPTAIKGLMPIAPGTLARFSERAPGRERTYDIIINGPDGAPIFVETFPVGSVQNVFVNSPELGKMSETFLADDQGFFITSHRYASEAGHSHPISSRPMQSCLAGGSGEALDTDYRDVAVIHGFAARSKTANS
jgi:hypothetical protein